MLSVANRRCFSNDPRVCVHSPWLIVCPAAPVRFLVASLSSPTSRPIRMTKILYEKKTVWEPKKVLLQAINRINDRIAHERIEEYPQLAIFSFDHIGLVINTWGRYERDILAAISHFISRHDPAIHQKTALDIGANIGNHSVFFAETFSEVFSFEPNPKTFELLKFNANFNSSKGSIKPYNLGLSSKNTALPFAVGHTNSGGSKIVRGNNKNSDSLIEVGVQRLDDVQDIKDRSVGLIKIDVEGHEPEVLRGAERTIAHSRPIILIEQDASEITDGSSESLEILKSHKYSFLVVQQNADLGGTLLGKLTSAIIRTFIGSKMQICRVDKFEKRYYQTIIAVPDDVLQD